MFGLRYKSQFDLPVVARPFQPIVFVNIKQQKDPQQVLCFTGKTPVS